MTTAYKQRKKNKKAQVIDSMAEIDAKIALLYQVAEEKAVDITPNTEITEEQKNEILQEVENRWLKIQKK